jgi:hypothetical protein
MHPKPTTAGSLRWSTAAHAAATRRKSEPEVGAVEFWIGGSILYVVLLITLGIITIRRGHWVMFVIGLFLPLFWLIGALLPPIRSEY